MGTSMKNISIYYDDIIYSLQKSGGGSVYWTEILKCAPRTAHHILYNSAHENIFYNEDLTPNAIVKSDKKLSVKRFLPVKVPRDEKFVFHSSYYRYCNNRNAVNITTVHDFTNDLFGKGFLAFLRKMRKRIAVMHSDGVICISENTKQDFLKMYPNFQGEYRVIYNGYDEESYYVFPEIDKEKIALFVGARSGYKRFDLALEILSYFPEIKLYIIGGGNLTEFEQDCLDSKLQGRYKKLGFVSNTELRELYNKATFLCYPSEYEGFGIPILEAQACGCPVICQKKSCMPEVGGDAAVYFESNNITDVLRLKDAQFYSTIREKGLENVKRFSWKKTGAEVLQFYEELFDKK